MAEKAPCRWRESTGETKPEFVKAWCTHPLSLHIAAFERCGKLVAVCHGCPCHEPEPAKDTTQKGDGDAVATD